MLKASLIITYDRDLTPYWFHENFREEKKKPHSLSRWVSWAIYNFRQEHEKVELSTLFGDIEIIVLGFPGYGAEEEADLIFNGLLNLQASKAKIYRFRHIDEPPVLYRSLSYAVLIATKNSSRHLWVIFPDTAGLDSGGAYQTYLHFERLITKLSKKIEIDVKKIDVPYEKFEAFLFKHATCFHRSKEGIDCIHPAINFPSCPKILENSESQFNAFVKCFDNNEFGQALRDLRALIQQAEENVLKLKCPEYEIPANTNITKLAGTLISKKLLQGKMIPWFDAFVSVANQSSHKDFPSPKEMENPDIRKRVMLTFETGLQVLEELNTIVYPRIDFFHKVEFNVKNT